jgi:tetratricopeptide (TPR) repeat protein
MNAACWAARANALRLNRQYDRALADFNNSINLEGTNALVIYRRGLTYVAMKKPDLALADFNESLRLDPKGDNCLNERGNIFMNEKRDFKRAIDDYSKAIMLNPGYAEFWTNRARAKRAAGLYDAALADHGEAIRIDPTNAVRWNSRGVLYESNQRDFPRAIADYSEAIKLKPAESLYRLNRGNAYRLNRDYAQAIADYNDSIRLDAKEPLSFNGRGLAQERIGNRKAAIADFGEAIRLDPSEPIYWSNRARAYRNGQDHALAKLDYLEAIRLSPLDAQALNNCAWHLATCLDPSVRDGALALQLAMRACELTAGADWSKLDTAAAAFAECGDFDRAILWSKAALAAARTDADRSEVKSSLVLYEIGQPARVP